MIFNSLENEVHTLFFTRSSTILFNMIFAKKIRLVAVLLAAATLALLPACSAKYGCPANESLKPKTNKKGEVTSSPKKHSGLFPKNMKKKMGH